MPPEPLLRPRDVARLLSIGTSTVYRLAEAGVLPTVKIPGTTHVRFKAERVEELLKQWSRNGNGNGRRRRQAANDTAQGT